MSFWPHCSCVYLRILSRTFPADSFLADVIQTTVGGPEENNPKKRGILEIIDASEEFSAEFKTMVSETEDGIGAKVWNLGIAHHRYDSLAKPLRRCALWWLAVLGSAERIYVKRRNKAAGKYARDFLRWADSEKYLALVCTSILHWFCSSASLAADLLLPCA